MRQTELPCSIDDCPNSAWSRGLCNTHYQRWRRHGDPTIYRRDPNRTALERFLSFCEITANGCVEWTGTRIYSGYGQFHPGGSANMVRAHRWAYEHFVAPIPDGHEIDHLCRNRVCVLPAHLEPVTHLENMGRSRRTHCKRGHEFTEATTYTDPRTGNRTCRVCRDVRNSGRWVGPDGTVVTTADLEAIDVERARRARHRSG